MENNDTKSKIELLQLDKLNQMLFNYHSDAIYTLTLEGNFYMVNDELCQITGRSRGQLIGSSFIPLIHPDYAEATIKIFSQLSGGKPERFETAIVTALNEVVYLDVTCITLKADEEAVGVFGIAKDITEKQHREEALRKAADILKAQNEELEIFRRIIAHDMRSPVSNAIGFAKLLTEAQLPKEVESEVKTLLRRTIESLDVMIRDLNEVISLKAKGTEAKEKVSLLEEVNKLVSQFEEEIGKTKATVNILVPSELSVVTIKAYFESIIRNLISNAIKYRSPLRAPEITIEAKEENGYLLLSVKDNGIGMDMSKVSNDLFKMQKRFAPSVADGNGWGLYIIHEQVKLLGGHVTVDSYPDQGTTFTIFLPLA